MTIVAMSRARIRFRFSSMSASPTPTLEQELKPEHPAPERGAVRYRITVGIFHMFPDAIHLHLHEPVQRPVHAESQHAVATGKDRLRSGIAERLVESRPDAVEPQSLDARRHFDASDTALEQRCRRLQRPLLVFAGHH